MKLSFDWLSDYVDLSGLTPQEVADKLTMGAFEVEEVREFGPDLKGDIVVGEIMEILPHPNADKIRLTKTRVKEGAEPLEIVCGAWNIEVGHRIPVALPGSTVINRKDGTPLNIVVGQIRGVTSNGMLCSPPELGITGSDEGILLLGPDAPIGADIRELLQIKRDAVLIVGTRSNRGDALSVLGMAREVAALFGRPLRTPQWTLPAEVAGSDSVKVSIENEQDSPFFTVRRLSGLSNPPSPPWMVRRLEAVGVRSVSSIVDVTNYVMHELGQPLHAYDVRHIDGNEIKVRRGATGEKLVTIDEKQRELNNEILVIADARKVVGVAGVMGGKGSEIADDSSEIALEAASFAAARVRRSSRLLGLSSDSSLRFERGVDPAAVRYASDRAAYLLATICGAKVGPLSSAGSDKVETPRVNLRLSQITRLTELNVKASEVKTLLSPLGFEVSEAAGEDSVSVTVPSFRASDVTREADLIEEVCRLYGYDRVPVSMPGRTIAPPLPDTLPRIIKESLSACGLNEAWVSSLVALSDLNGKNLVATEEEQAIKVLNPLSEDHQVMRTSLIPGLLKAVAYNQDRGQSDCWLFEIGLSYKRDLDPGSPIDQSNTGTSETAMVAAVISGENKLSRWDQTAGDGRGNATKTDFYILKGVAENLFARLGLPREQLVFSAEDNTPGWFHPSRSAKIIVKGRGRDKAATPDIELGWLGEIHPALADAYGLKQSASIFELSVPALRAARKARTLSEIYQTPTVVRDVTADVLHTVQAGPIRQTIAQVSGKLLRHVELVSVFDLSDEKKSLSYRLTFQDAEKTLTTDEVEKVVGKVRQQLSRLFAAEFRS